MCPRMIVFLAAAGIGRSVAKVLARDYGYDVFAGVRKTKDMDSITAEGIQGLHPLILDVTKPAQVTAAVAEVKKLGKPLVALVNVSDPCVITTMHHTCFCSVCRAPVWWVFRAR
jgi:NAD(P)-dependent dehydrogenase (short-subunit alcohol dehydrogenase family)